MLPATFAFGQKFHDNRPIWFHAENLAMHFLAILAAFYAFREVFRRRRTAIIAGTLLALHPVNVTITSWIGGRTDTMALGFMALYALGVMRLGRIMRVEQRQRHLGKPPRMRKALILWLSLSLLSLLAAIFTKEQSMGLVFLAPLMAMSVRGAVVSSRKRRFPFWTAVYLLPAAVFLLVVLNVMKELNFDHSGWSVPLHIEMVGRTLAYYASEFFLPTVNDQHVSTIGAWSVHLYARAAIGYIVAVAWVTLIVRYWSIRRVRLLMLWSSLCIGTVLNVIPIPNALAAPFRTAVAMFGISGLLAALLSCGEFIAISRQDRNPIIAQLKLAGIAGLFIWYLSVTAMDLPNWQNEWTYSQAEVRADPNFVCARASVGSGWYRRGNYTAALAKFDECTDMLFGRETSPDEYVKMLRSPEMLPVMQSMSTLRYRPMQYIPQVIRERGRTLKALGRYDDAIKNLRASLTVSPDDTDARTALADCYDAIGKHDQAQSVRRMEDVLQGKPL